MSTSTFPGGASKTLPPQRLKDQRNDLFARPPMIFSERRPNSVIRITAAVKGVVSSGLGPRLASGRV
jgi:hypothetical protein